MVLLAIPVRKPFHSVRKRLVVHGKYAEGFVDMVMNRRMEPFCFFSSRRRHTIFDCDWSSDVCSSDLVQDAAVGERRSAADGDVRPEANRARVGGGFSEAAAVPDPLSHYGLKVIVFCVV